MGPIKCLYLLSGRLIVGAPKNSNTSIGGGNIYKCDLKHESSCLQYPIGMF